MSEIIPERAALHWLIGLFFFILGILAVIVWLAH